MRIFRICTLFIEGLGKHVKAGKNCVFFFLSVSQIDFREDESTTQTSNRVNSFTFSTLPA